MYFIAPPKFISTSTSFADVLINTNFIAVYPELFLIIIISFLIAFLVVLDHVYEYKFFLSSLAANILI
jgi:hypothetical protein